jgi:RNA polymerase subunit RPABC4/transcription elongation factor Spt4
MTTSTSAYKIVLNIKECNKCGRLIEAERYICPFCGYVFNNIQQDWSCS